MEIRHRPRPRARVPKHGGRRWAGWLAPAALLSATACLFHQKGEEQGQMAWLAAAQDTEFPQHTPRPESPVAPAARAAATPLPPDRWAAPLVGIAAGTQVTEPTGPAVDDPDSAATRPVLRVVGAGKGAPAARDRVELTLPDEGASGAVTTSANVKAPANASDPTPKQQYTHGLALMNAHDYDRALETFSAVILKWPDDPVVEGALYWSGESYLAKGDLLAAVADFERVLSRSPEGEKAPDSLLKLGVCEGRLGNPARSRSYFDRLARDYPKSEATRRIPNTR